jgi:hypothetical protein
LKERKKGEREIISIVVPSLEGLGDQPEGKSFLLPFPHPRDTSIQLPFVDPGKKTTTRDWIKNEDVIVQTFLKGTA